MSTLRITGGLLRGRRIPVPHDEVRPTSERARQAYFNIVATRIGGARFLDLFSGSGIFSFEAMSRGAASATAVDQSRRHGESVGRLAATLGIDVRTVNADVLQALRKLGREPFDLVYADPPYAYERYDDLLAAIAALPLTPAALVAVEHRRRSEPFTLAPPGLTLTRRAEYGEVWISFFTTSSPATPLATDETAEG